MRATRAFLIWAVAVVAIAQPPVVFVQTDIDAGTIPSDQGYASFSFSFSVQGDQPVQIADVKASCTCLSLEYPKGPIAPGASGAITGEAALPGGPFRVGMAAIFLGYEDAPQELHFAGRRAWPDGFIPGQVAFEGLDWQPKTLTRSIQYLHDITTSEPLAMHPVLPTAPLLTIVPADPHRVVDEYKDERVERLFWDLTLEWPGSEDEIVNSLEFAIEGKEELLSIPVIARAMPRVSVRPPVVSLGMVRAAQGMIEIPLRVTLAQGVDQTDLILPSTGTVRMTLPEGASGAGDGTLSALLHVDVARLKTGYFETDVEIFLKGATTPAAKVPVSGLIALP